MAELFIAAGVGVGVGAVGVALGMFLIAWWMSR